jgi:predicted TIM-barrel fold metal-dependent hydrolase
MAPNYKYVSADSHLEVPPDVWGHWVPERYRDMAPRRIKLPNGSDAFVVEGRLAQRGGMNLFSGTRPEDYEPRGINWDDFPGTGGAEQRLQELDQDGVDAEVLYPGPGSAALVSSLNDKGTYKVLISAYNDWLGQEFCAVNPKRLIGMGLIPNTNAEDAIAEMEHCAKIGLKGVYLSTFPNGQRYPTPGDDAFWSAALAMDMPITIHISFAGVRPAPAFKYPIEPEGDDKPGADYLERLTRYARAGGMDATQLVIAGVFDRFPNLRLYWAENQIGWVPNFLEQLDNNYRVNHFWAEKILGMPKLAKWPSEYIREHCWWGFMYNPVGVQARHQIGVDKCMWGSDFPHIESDWPNSMRIIDEMFDGVPDDERHAMVAGNCIDFFHLD